MKKETFTFVKLFEFANVCLFKASDNPGERWTTYGRESRVDVNIITSPDKEGWAQVTFHNERTGAMGVNFLVVPNLVALLSRNEPKRITFKALSLSFGCNGKKNMYCMLLESKEDAEKMCYLCEFLQMCATEAQEGRPVTKKEITEDRTATQVLFASENEALIHGIKSKLLELAQARAKQDLRITLKYVEDIRAAAETNHDDINNKQPLGVVAEEKEVVAPFEITIGKLRNVKIGDDPSDDHSIESSEIGSPVGHDSQDWITEFARAKSQDSGESQDFMAAFK
jgi:hypothetical protein